MIHHLQNDHYRYFVPPSPRHFDHEGRWIPLDLFEPTSTSLDNMKSNIPLAFSPSVSFPSAFPLFASPHLQRKLDEEPLLPPFLYSSLVTPFLPVPACNF
jgi:hypothetical protein